MADDDWSSTSSWSSTSGDAGSGADYWTPERMAQAQPMGMWGSPTSGYGMQSPYGGYPSPYSSPYSGFGGGMAYGGGYPTQSPYGAYGGYSGGYSPYGMQSPYGGYGMTSPYGMQSPYGYQSSPYDMQAYGMAPQSQMMATAAPATGDATTAEATATGDVTPTGAGANDGSDPQAGGPLPANWWENIKGSTTQETTFKPWENLAQEYAKLFPEAQHEFFRQYGRTDAQGVFHPGQGPLGFDPSSEAALARMEELAQGGNPMLGQASTTTRDIMSGNADIQGGMYMDMYGRPSISNAGQYSDMYNDPGITGQSQYQNMANRDAIENSQNYRDMIQRDAIAGGRYQELYQNPAVGEAGYGALRESADAMRTGRMEDIYGGPGVNADRYQQIYGGPGVNTDRMQQIYGGPGVGTGNYQNILGDASGAGSLAGGMFGRTASGAMVDSNPYREQAIKDAMAQTSDEVKATMSSRGRYGSDAYGDAMGRALGQVATTARMQGYDTDTQNMMAAAQARSGEGLARQGIGLQAAQGIAGAQGTNVANRLAAAQGIQGGSAQDIQNRLAATGGIAGIQGQNIANRMGAAQSIMGAQGQNWQNQLAAMQGLTGAQAQNAAQRMGAAAGMAGLEGTNAAQRLAQIQGLSGIQGQNYQASLGALGQMNQAQQMANQQRMAAASGLSGIQGQNWQNQLGALQGFTGVQGQNLQNRMQAAGMMPMMQQLRYDDASRLAQAGAAREAMAQQQRDFGWTQMNQYRGILGNLPGSAGQQIQEANQPWWQNALGLAAGIGGIWGGAGG